MSRNDKMRRMAEKLPPFPKLDGKKVQRDSKGDIIYVNHFRELKKMQEKYKNPKDPALMKEWTKYSLRVMEYNKQMNERKNFLNKSWGELMGYFVVFAMVVYAVGSFLDALGFNDLIFQVKNQIRQLLK